MSEYQKQIQEAMKGNETLKNAQEMISHIVHNCTTMYEGEELKHGNKTIKVVMKIHKNGETITAQCHANNDALQFGSTLQLWFRNKDIGNIEIDINIPKLLESHLEKLQDYYNNHNEDGKPGKWVEIMEVEKGFRKERILYPED